MLECYTGHGLSWWLGIKTRTRQESDIDLLSSAKAKHVQYILKNARRLLLTVSNQAGACIKSPRKCFSLGLENFQTLINLKTKGGSVVCVHDAVFVF